MAGPVADFVVSLGQGGRVLSQGTLSEALKSNKALLEEVNAEKEEVAEVDEIIDDALPLSISGRGGKLIAKEEVAEGHVGSQARGWYYFYQRVAQHRSKVPSQNVSLRNGRCCSHLLLGHNSSLLGSRGSRFGTRECYATRSLYSYSLHILAANVVSR